MLSFQLETHPDYPRLAEAKMAIEEIIKAANENKRVADNLREIEKIQQSINWGTFDVVSIFRNTKITFLQY